MKVVQDEEITPEHLVSLTIPEAIERWPFTKSVTFKCKGKTYFIVGRIPNTGSLTLLNTIAFVPNGPVLRSQFKVEAQEEWGEMSLKEFGEEVKATIHYLKSIGDEETLNEYLKLGFDGQDTTV